MATKECDSTYLDMLYIKFRCKRCNDIVEIDNIEFQKDPEQEIECPSCKFVYKIVVRQDVFSSCVNISDLPQGNFMSLNPIPFESSFSAGTCFFDMLDEQKRLKNAVKDIEALSTPMKGFLYEALWCRTISMMDSCAGYLIRYHVFHDKKCEDKYLQTLNNTKISRETALDQLKRTSFQDITRIKKYFRALFGIQIFRNSMIADAVERRNTFIHHLGRGERNEVYTVNKTELLNLIDIVSSFVEDMDKRLHEYNMDKSVRKALKRNETHNYY